MLTSPSSTTLKAKAQQSPSALLDRKIDEITAGLPASFNKNLRSISEANAPTIVDYIAALKAEINPSDNYRRDLIQALSVFSRYCDNRPFKDITRTDVIAFLETYRKTETQDPLKAFLVHSPKEEQ